MAAGGPSPTRSYVERMALTRLPAIPTQPGLGGAPIVSVPGDPGPGSTAPGDGLQLAGLFAVNVTVIANQGQTLSGGGTLYCWVWDVFSNVPKRIQDLDLSMTWNGVGVQQVRGFGTLQALSRLGGYLLFLTNAVTVSGGGADVLVRLDGFTSVGNAT